MLWSLPVALHALALSRAAVGRDDADGALQEGARIARETGAALVLEAIEAARETIGAAP
jgi:hypothetical protein